MNEPAILFATVLAIRLITVQPLTVSSSQYLLPTSNVFVIGPFYCGN
jgi:hypothetical protein